MGKKTSAPPAPDYVGAAKQTAQSNLEAARAAAAANRVNQITPYGTLTYSQKPRQFNQAGYDEAMRNYNAQIAAQQAARPAQPQYNGASRYGAIDAAQQAYNPQSMPQLKPPSMDDFYSGSPDDGWTAEVKLDPAQQALLDQQNALSRQSGDIAGQYLTSLQGNGKSAADIGYNAIMDRLNPQLEQQRKSFDTQMANQGIGLGSEAYNNAWKNQYQAENDARTQAALQGIGIGNSTLANQMNMINALRNGGQVTNPTFVNTPQQATTGGVDYSGAAGLQNQYNMGLYNSQVAQKNSGLGGLFGLGASALSGGLFKGLFGG